MPRANRYIVAGHSYHVTHRCHNRAFLFRFARDRDEYRNRLRIVCAESELSVLGYCITSNHTHLLVHSETTAALSDMMQRLEGQFAEAYNLRKRRSGAFWDGRYHATMIESGKHLWNCLRYIDLNMVRAGVVRHPRDWKWCGWHELEGIRRRYRVISPDKVVEKTEAGDIDRFRTHYAGRVDEAASQGGGRREPEWTESIAVGGQAFVERMMMAVGPKREDLEVSEAGSGRWIVKETAAAYT